MNSATAGFMFAVMWIQLHRHRTKQNSSNPGSRWRSRDVPHGNNSLAGRTIVFNWGMFGLRSDFDTLDCHPEQISVLYQFSSDSRCRNNNKMEVSKTWLVCFSILNINNTHMEHCRHPKQLVRQFFWKCLPSSYLFSLISSLQEGLYGGW